MVRAEHSALVNERSLTSDHLPDSLKISPSWSVCSERIRRIDELWTVCEVLLLSCTVVLIEYSTSIFLLRTSRVEFDSFSLLRNLFVRLIARFSDNASRGRIVTVRNASSRFTHVFPSRRWKKRWFRLQEANAIQGHERTIYGTCRPSR